MNKNDRQQQFIVDYLACEAPDETVEHLEKVASERILGRDREVWDVHTDRDRWWVITEPTNLYSQKQFPSLDVALSFHVGVIARVEEREARSAAPEQRARAPRSWRKWEQAGVELNRAREGEDFQAVGMRCRESLIAFALEAAGIVPKSTGRPLPKAADFVGWSEAIADTICPGPSGERRRGYLKSIAKATWDLAQWLTHTTGATPFDAHFVFKATAALLSACSISLLRFEAGAPERCPRCSSYQLYARYEEDPRNRPIYATSCEVCDWKHAALITPNGAHAVSMSTRRRRRKNPTGDCVVVEVPLRGPAPPKRSARIRRRISLATRRT